MLNTFQSSNLPDSLFIIKSFCEYENLEFDVLIHKSIELNIKGTQLRIGIEEYIYTEGFRLEYQPPPEVWSDFKELDIYLLYFNLVWSSITSAHFGLSYDAQEKRFAPVLTLWLPASYFRQGEDVSRFLQSFMNHLSDLWVNITGPKLFCQRFALFSIYLSDYLISINNIPNFSSESAWRGLLMDLSEHMHLDQKAILNDGSFISNGLNFRLVLNEHNSDIFQLMLDYGLPSRDQNLENTYQELLIHSYYMGTKNASVWAIHPETQHQVLILTFALHTHLSDHWDGSLGHNYLRAESLKAIIDEVTQAYFQLKHSTTPTL